MGKGIGFLGAGGVFALAFLVLLVTYWLGGGGATTLTGGFFQGIKFPRPRSYVF